MMQMGRQMLDFYVMIRYIAVWVDALAEEIAGIFVFSGKNFTVFPMRSALAFEMYTL